jgi:hypothetical protein
MWALGGIWMARAAFTLRKNEEVICRAWSGPILENWLPICLHNHPSVGGHLGAAVVIFLGGILFSMPDLRKNPPHSFKLPVKTAANWQRWL